MDNINTRGLTMNFTKATLAAGTTTTLSSSTACTYSIKGKIYVQGAAWTNQATPTANADGSAFTAVPRGSSTDGGYGCVFVIGVDSGGNMKVQQGELVRLTPDAVATATFRDAPEFPAIPDTMCPLGYMLLKVDSNLVAASWTFGASNLASLTGTTKTFVDCSTLPDRPQTS